MFHIIKYTNKKRITYELYDKNNNTWDGSDYSEPRFETEEQAKSFIASHKLNNDPNIEITRVLADCKAVYIEKCCGDCDRCYLG